MLISVLRHKTVVVIAPLLAAICFITVLLAVASNRQKIFMSGKGVNHKIAGFMLLIWIMIGYYDAIYMHFGPPSSMLLCKSRFIYDIMLSTLGYVTTISAASDFPHKGIKNMASGVLDKHATVTQSEMIEHSFYQLLNLFQIVYIHCMSIETFNIYTKSICLLLVSLPWLYRNCYPVNHFSDNYNQNDLKSTALIRILYRIKKYQYVFYKHFLLHGLNICLYISYTPIANDPFFRLYWILLNTSYCFEFFLQTLVKKSYMEQSTMLILQKILMTAASIASIHVLAHVNVYIALASMILNFLNRQMDLQNTTIVTIASYYMYHIRTV